MKREVFRLMASAALSTMAMPAPAQDVPQAAPLSAQTPPTATVTLPKNYLEVQLLALDAQGNPLGALKDLKSDANDPTSAFGPPGTGRRFGGDPTPMIQWFQNRAHIALANNGITLNARQKIAMEQGITREALYALDRMKPEATAGMAIQVLIDTPNGAKVMTIAGAFSNMTLPRDVGVFSDTLLSRRDWGTEITDYQLPVIQLTSTPETDPASNALATELVKTCKIDRNLQPAFASAVYNKLSANMQPFINGPQPLTYQFRVEKLGVEGAVQAMVGLNQDQNGGVGFILTARANSVCQKFQPTAQPQ